MLGPASPRTISGAIKRAVPPMASASLTVHAYIVVVTDAHLSAFGIKKQIAE